MAVNKFAKDKKNSYITQDLTSCLDLSCGVDKSWDTEETDKKLLPHQPLEEYNNRRIKSEEPDDQIALDGTEEDPKCTKASEVADSEGPKNREKCNDDFYINIDSSNNDPSGQNMNQTQAMRQNRRGIRYVHHASENDLASCPYLGQHILLCYLSLGSFVSAAELYLYPYIDIEKAQEVYDFRSIFIDNPKYLNIEWIGLICFLIVIWAYITRKYKPVGAANPNTFLKRHGTLVGFLFWLGYLFLISFVKLFFEESTIFVMCSLFWFGFLYLIMHLFFFLAFYLGNRNVDLFVVKRFCQGVVTIFILASLTLYFFISVNNITFYVLEAKTFTPKTNQ
ncbi:hypothetical protein NEMIN01_1370 [Nematocida minor]|uniref:uncharacterized protein n=1 Tax=Nematocida minor TaxID=1912983 RepID=UPI00221EB7E6|nr:uncharacterized protein NEMIN01_1370 [Nematocida minor]KAI5191101.1 hypothetical protein NEMIN01_1370 [Nematocida minor]